MPVACAASGTGIDLAAVFFLAGRGVGAAPFLADARGFAATADFAAGFDLAGGFDFAAGFDLAGLGAGAAFFRVVATQSSLRPRPRGFVPCGFAPL